MVAVPAHRTGHMESDLVVEEQHGGNLVGHHLGRMIMTVVHQADDAVSCSIVDGKLAGTYGV